MNLKEMINDLMAMPAANFKEWDWQFIGLMSELDEFNNMQTNKIKQLWEKQNG